MDYIKIKYQQVQDKISNIDVTIGKLKELDLDDYTYGLILKTLTTEREVLEVCKRNVVSDYLTQKITKWA